MTEFLTILASFPTVIFTVALGIVVLYWLLAMLGAVDLEVLDAADGALDGAVDGAIDGAIDGAVDGATDGAAEGAAESGGAMLMLANVVRLGRIPATVTISLLAFWGWIAAFLLTWLFRHPLDGLLTPTLYGVVALGGAMGVAVGLTNVASRPIEPFFRSHEGRRRASLIGEVAEIDTGRVDHRFGQARVQLGGDDLVVHVRCDRPGNGLKKGDRALIVHFDTQRDAFVVEPLTAGETIESRAASRSVARAITTDREG